MTETETEIIIKQSNDRYRMMREYLTKILNGLCRVSIFENLPSRCYIKSIVIILSIKFLFLPSPSYFDNLRRNRRYADAKEDIFNYLVYFNRETEH